MAECRGKRRLQPPACASALLAIALAATSCRRDVAIATTADAFQITPTSRSGVVEHQQRKHRGAPHARRRGTPATTSTSLHVFDFLKRAQDEASQSMSAFAAGLAKSRNQFLYNLEQVASGDKKNLLDSLEDTLLQSDLGVATTDDVLEEARFLREESVEIFGADDIKALLRGKLLEALGASAEGSSSRYSAARARAGKALVDRTTAAADDATDGGEEEEDSDAGGSFALRFANPDDAMPASASTPLTVHFIMGANGMGKTTTIGKLAHRLKSEAGRKVLLAACDTFRAGAVAQLEMWAERADVDCHSPSESTNGPSAVLFGALDRALAGGYDTLLVDTSGRLSNNDALTAELVKMKRVIQKRMSTGFDEKIRPVPNLAVPHETLLVIDAAQGRMALDSAKQWNKELGLTGLILTKLDGSAKGGSVVAVSRELGLPVKLVGVGEGMEDLRDRSQRAKATAASTAKASQGASPTMIGGGPAGEMTLQGLDDMAGADMMMGDDGMGEMQLITPGGGGGGGGNRSKNKKKKRKKKGKRC